MSGFELNYIQGSAAAIAVYQWITASPRYLLLLVHGHSEHIGHYESVARHFQSHGAYVFGPDHPGHGLSQGERLVIEDFDAVVNDVGNVVASVRCQYPDLPLYVVGHSMGGMIATRYVQLNSGEVRGLVLSAPLLGSRTRITDLYAIPQQAFLREGKTVKKGEKVGPFMRRTLAAMERMLMLINGGPGFGNLPALWLHGTQDTTVLAEETQTAWERLRGIHCEADNIPGARHDIFCESYREITLAKMTRFIDACMASECIQTRMQVNGYPQ